MTRRVTVLFALVLLALAGAASAYTVYLKDGSSVVTKTKYRQEGDKVYLILPSGTESVIDAAQVDFERTDRENRGPDYGTAKVIRNGRAERLEEVRRSEEDKRLSDLITERQVRTRLPGNATREERPEEPTSTVFRTATGAVDLDRFPREDLGNESLRDELTSFLRGQGLLEASIYQGTRSGVPLVEVVADSETEVFEALRTASNALLHLQAQFDGRPSSLELYLVTQRRERAGQFDLDASTAESIVSKSVEMSTFFLENVQF